MRAFETTTDLMPHQTDAVKKVSPTRVGALFMEMGTGKSRTSIELVRKRIRKIDHVVWFCPVSLKETVRQEIIKHTDCTDICVFDDKINERNVPKARWYVAGIESMSSSNRVVITADKIITDKTFVICDESSYIKGHRSMRTQRITRISERAKYRLILTGTPLSQGVVDLYSQMKFLSPLILGYNSFYSFAANHLEYSEKFPGRIVRAHNTEYLAAKIQPYVYQVTKAECLNLPEKLYESRYFNMSREQEEWYSYAKDEILSEDFEDDWSSIAIFRLFTALQEITSGFWNRRDKDGNMQRVEFDQTRLDTLLDVVMDMPKDEKVIIFAKFQYDVNCIKAALENKYGSGCVAVFTGAIPTKHRESEVEKFRGNARFFLTTQSCGGHGLTLNEAHYVIFYNNGFKYSERMQAEGRPHRIGQKYVVTYIDICCDCGIDRRIEHALSNKGNVVSDFKEEIDKVKDKKSKLKELIKSL